MDWRCNCLINAHAEAGNSERAEQRLAYMMENGIKMTLPTFNCVVRACALQGRVERAVHWINQAKASFSQLSKLTYAPVIEHFARHGQPDRAEKLLEEVWQSGFAWNEVDYGCMVTACANARDLGGAQTWCDRMERSGYGRGVYEYTQLLKACGSQSLACEAERIFREQLGRCIAPDHFNLKALNSVLGRGRAQALCEELNVDCAKAEREFEAMKDELGAGRVKPSRLDEEGLVKRHLFED